MSAEIEVIPPSQQPGIVVQWTPTGPPSAGGSGFLPPPGFLDESDTYFFLGWDQLNTGWLIRRVSRVTGAAQSVSGASDFNTAWTNRANLEYV